MKEGYHHGEDIDKYKDEILENSNLFYNDLFDTLEKIEYMIPYYQWNVQKQKEYEKIYYEYEKRMLSYLVFGNDSVCKEHIVGTFVKIYSTLIFKYVKWYGYSEYKNLRYSTQELETMLKSHFVDSVYKYVGKYKEIRIPFGSYLKKRIFIQFRGELQDFLRKTVLYNKWKPILYEADIENIKDLDKIHEYSSVESKMKILKEYFLYESPLQKVKKYDEHFFHNFLFVYHFVEKKPITHISSVLKVNILSFIETIKNELQDFKDKFDKMNKHGHHN